MNPNNEAVSVTDSAKCLCAGQKEAGRDGSVSLRNRTRNSTLATDVTVANTYFPRLVGLLGKGCSWADAERALWIIPSRGVHMFGMRFAIDVVFLDCNRSVVHIQENLRPWQVSSVVRGARSVLELPVGTISRSGTQLGDHVEVVYT